MKYATFHNFTSKPFTGYWNGKAYTFQPGAKKMHLNENLARHFAKHLANQVLTESGKETFTSPKRPLDVPEFMEVFNKAFILEGHGEEVDSETGLPVDEVNGRMPDQPSMNIRTAPRVPVDPYDANANQAVGPGGAPQIIGSATEGEDDEDSFEGKGDAE